MHPEDKKAAIIYNHNRIKILQIPTIASIDKGFAFQVRLLAFLRH
jgi:hypothetical protein